MLNSDLIVGFGTLGLAVVAFLATRDLSRLGGVFVDFTLWALLILSILEIAKGFMSPDRIRFFESKDERTNILVGLGILAGYIVLLPLVGFLPSSLLFFTVLNLYLGDERITRPAVLKSLGLAAVVVATFNILFCVVLEVPLPKGVLFCG